MSPFDPEPELDQRLRELARNSSREPFVADEVWAFAAGELPAAEAAEVAARVLANRGAALELAYASHVLDERTAIDVEAARQSADRVLAAIRAAQRPAWRLSLKHRRGRTSVAFALAAAALIAVLVMLRGVPPAPEVHCAVASLASGPMRGGSTISSLRYRLSLQPTTAAHVAVFDIAHRSAGVEVRRRFPLHPKVLEAADSPYHAWPVNPLPAAVTLLPPAADALLDMPVTAGHAEVVVLVASSAAPLDEAVVVAILQELKDAAIVAGGVTVAAGESLAALLRARGLTVRLLHLRP